MITKLKPNQIFVFGSNLAGRHGKGAALWARNYFGAQYRTGEGPTGRCYAIPTKDVDLSIRQLPDIYASVRKFLSYADVHPELQFLVTPIGCGLAGYNPSEIAPMFLGCHPNVVLPKEFLPSLNKISSPLFESESSCETRDGGATL